MGWMTALGAAWGPATWHTAAQVQRSAQEHWGLRLILCSSKLFWLGAPEHFWWQMVKDQKFASWTWSDTTWSSQHKVSPAPISHLILPGYSKQEFCPSYLKELGPLWCYQMGLCTEILMRAFSAENWWQRPRGEPDTMISSASNDSYL